MATLFERFIQERKYLKNVSPPQIEWHLENCRHCIAVYSGTRNIVQLLGNRDAIELPVGFSRRLYRRLFS